MGDGLAMVAAIAFAFGTVLQQKGTLSTTAGAKDPRFLLQILHQPVWLAGLLFQVVGWILQAMALDRAPLTVVQSLISLSLVVALFLGVWLTGQHVGGREIAGAAFTLVGIGLFLSAGQPQGGTTHPSATTWWLAGLVTLAFVVVLFTVGGRLGGAEAALTLGMAAGLCFGLQAAVTKTFVTELGGGLAGLLSSWSVYVLIASALIGFVLQQSALKTDVLAPAMASSNSVTLFSSVVLGVAVYGEKLSGGGGTHAGLAILGLAVAIMGIVLLAGSAAPRPTKSASMDPST